MPHLQTECSAKSSSVSHSVELRTTSRAEELPMMTAGAGRHNEAGSPESDNKLDYMHKASIVGPAPSIYLGWSGRVEAKESTLFMIIDWNEGNKMR